jgi:uncharacterized protein (UPF0276 family)
MARARQHERCPSGIGLRVPHAALLMRRRPPLGFVEVHAENYMGGGPLVAQLESVRRDYRVALHGVGLSIGSAGPLDRHHLAALRALVDRIDPCFVSEHLSWSVARGAYLNHLLPLPYTEEALDVVSAHVIEIQEGLGRQVLIENPSSYLRFRHSTLSEPEFLTELTRRSGCALLCDVNNVHVSAHNLGFDPGAYVDALPPAAVRELHLAGHSASDADGRTILIDDHGAPVASAVWDLYERAIRRFGAIPTLVEWDTDLPALDVLLDEARGADAVVARVEAGRAAAA